MFEDIINPRYTKLLRAIGKKRRSINEISREMSMTVAHLSRKMTEGVSEGFVKKTFKDGREYGIELTPKGVKLLDLLNKILEVQHQETKSEDTSDNKTKSKE